MLQPQRGFFIGSFIKVILRLSMLALGRECFVICTLMSWLGDCFEKLPWPGWVTLLSTREASWDWVIHSFILHIFWASLTEALSGFTLQLHLYIPVILPLWLNQWITPRGVGLSTLFSLRYEWDAFPSPSRPLLSVLTLKKSSFVHDWIVGSWFSYRLCRAWLMGPMLSQIREHETVYSCNAEDKPLINALLDCV